jgi:hypothetical protein
VKLPTKICKANGGVAQRPLRLSEEEKVRVRVPPGCKVIREHAVMRIDLCALFVTFILRRNGIAQKNILEVEKSLHPVRKNWSSSKQCLVDVFGKHLKTFPYKSRDMHLSIDRSSSDVRRKGPCGTSRGIVPSM